jgi:hypothetical protein
LLPRNPPLSADFATNRNGWIEVSAVPEVSRNRSNVILIAGDGFATVKGTKARKEPLAFHHNLLENINSIRWGQKLHLYPHY